ncbi:hypothetical protein BDQ17DRAFT_1412926 [Cyathus striatus]|nr:hypothetical protein BDQ17DRAFT_1412926 [Cyathus striatus]
MDQIPIDPKLPKTKFDMTFYGMYGPQLIASMINATAYGATMTMVVQYFKYHSNSDTLLVKGTVILLAALATLETVCASHQMYEYLVYRFGRNDLLGVITKSVMGKYLGVYLTAFVAQLFYATRIWILTGHLTKHYRLLAYPVGVLLLIQVVTGLAQVFCMGYLKTFIELGYITYVTFSYALSLNKFIIYAVNRAAATSFCALLTVVMFCFLSGTYSYMIPLLLNTHLYVISVISVLTARVVCGKKIIHSIYQYCCTID